MAAAAAVEFTLLLLLRRVLTVTARGTTAGFSPSAVIFYISIITNVTIVAELVVMLISRALRRRAAVRRYLSL